MTKIENQVMRSTEMMAQNETPDIDCCQKFIDAVKDRKIEYFEGVWDIPGCCRGGCYVIKDIKCCPFCGEWLDCLPGPNVILGV